MKVSFHLFIAIMLATFGTQGHADPKDLFESRLGQRIDLSRPLIDENDQAQPIANFIAGRPTLVALVYYSCPNVCEIFLKGIALSLARLRRGAGEDYRLVVVSIDPLDQASLATERREQFLKTWRSSRHSLDEAGVHFLRGDAQHLNQFAKDLGFSFHKDPVSGEYSHPAALVFLSPQGKVVDYLYGMNFSEKDVSTGLDLAISNRTGSLINKFLIVCAHYLPLDKPQSQRLILWLRWGSVIFLSLFATTIFWYSLRRRPA